jgi:putative transposase
MTPDGNDPSVGQSLAVRYGSTVEHNGLRFVVTHILGFDAVLAEDAETGERQQLPVAELLPASAVVTTSVPDLITPTSPAWDEARRRLELIRPLLENAHLPRTIIQERAAQAGIDVTTIYRWARIFRASGALTSLLPFKPSGGRGKTRLPPAVDKIVARTIEEHFLTKQQRSPQSTAMEVRRRCIEAKLPVPHPNTVRRHILAVPPRQRLSRRAHRKEADDRFAPRPGTFDDARGPLDLVQIDHTKLDIIVVDEQRRLPIGRPWITLAIDVFSRMVVGLYISLDPPGAVATGLCIAHAVLPKETWLAKRGVVGQWPCWGFPKRIHLDNAKEFHGEMLRRACEQYGITLEYRPVATPHMGSHIERLLGTLLRALHELPGTTFSHPKQRGDYDSKATAAMTLNELDHWIAEYIVSVYHGKLHRGIMTAPLQRWTATILGDKQSAGNGMPSRPLDEERIRLDFMPFVERTIQQHGIVIDGIHYYGDVLRRFVGATHEGRKQSFLFRRDPRDISAVYFWDAELERYASIPYRNTAHPPISLWEFREVRRKLEEAGRVHIDESAIFDAYARLREREARAVNETKRVRRQREPKPSSSSPTSEPRKEIVPEAPVPMTYRIEDITPFEIEEA